MSNVEIIEPEKPEAAPSPPPWTITCESGDCPVTYAGHGTYGESWQAAYDSGWRADLSGVRRCPPCVAERQPVITLWLAGQAMTEYIARKVPPPGDLEARRTEIVLSPPLVPLPVQAVPMAPAASAVPAIPFDPIARLAADRHPPALGDLDPGREQALANFNALHDSQDTPETASDDTSIIPAVSAETETFAPVTEGDA